MRTHRISFSREERKIFNTDPKFLRAMERRFQISQKIVKNLDCIWCGKRSCKHKGMMTLVGMSHI